jgi:hypothetical protein
MSGRNGTRITAMHGIFISAPIDGRIYVAERNPKGHLRLLWSVVSPTLLGREERSNHAPSDACCPVSA